MNPTRIAPLLLLAALFIPPALAGDPDVAPPAEPAPAQIPQPGLVDMLSALGKFLTDEELQLIYDYLWESSLAALKGEPDDVELPPEVAFKLAILQKRIVKEGGHYLTGLAQRLERDLDRLHQELTTPSPPVPYSLPGEPPKP